MLRKTMSDRSSKLEDQASRHELSLNRIPPDHEPYDPEDPRLAEEAQLLLSQFMDKPARNLKEGSHRNSGTIVHGHAAFHQSERVSKDGVQQTDGRRADCLLSGSSRSGSSGEQRNSIARPSSTEKFTAMVTRRSRRPTSGPVNYYAKVSLGDSESDRDDSIAAEHNAASSSLRHQLPDPRPSTKSFIVYSSPDVQVIGEFFSLLDNIYCSTHACYAPESSPAGYAKRFRNNPMHRVLHVDFDHRELSAILNMLPFCGLQQDALCSDISLCDRLIRAVASTPTKEMFGLLVDKISWICELSQLLAKYHANDVESFLLAVMKPDVKPSDSRRIHRLIGDILGLQVENGQRNLSQYVGSDKFCQLLTHLMDASALRRRHRADLERFFSDAKNGRLATVPCYVQGITVRDSAPPTRKITRRPTNINNLLRSRELGNHVNQQVRSTTCQKFQRVLSWKGASNDVIVLAWSPDGTRFAVGATAQCDEHNMAYNRGNNLLLGDLTTNSLKELPDHWIPHSSQMVISNQTGMSPRLYMSVTAMQWFEDTLFTASYDNTVKLWDASNHASTFCFKTLRHRSKVQVMARSNFNENILATGTDSIGLWDLYEEEPKYTALELIRPKKDIELIPTSLAWGTATATNNILIAGMSERDPEDVLVPQNGHLGMWRASESDFLPVQLSPSSQNIFDVKWHPVLPAFATASSAPGTLRNVNSVVRIYEPLTSKRSIVEFDCPAIDINDVTFCPTNPNYVTASCTDGLTYIWDYRNPSEILHRLQHGKPLNQIDESLSREQADVGVRVALWGDSIDQFYTGASDGVLKLWNILLSPEDVLIGNKMTFPEEIMSGAFSGDKSNLLIGDSAGGVHILSSGAFVNGNDNCMNYERAIEPDYERNPELDSESGIEAAKALLSSGRLVRHPIYGVGQGPHYDGPFAAWARPEGTPKEEIPLTPLEEKYQMQQFRGVPVEDRQELDDQTRQSLAANMRLARIRNQKRNESKRKRNDRNEAGKTNKLTRDHNYIDLCTDDERLFKLPKSKRRTRGRVITRVEPEVIDLTGDTDSEDMAESPSVEGAKIKPYVGCSTVRSLSVNPEDWEEDFWWPASADVNANIKDIDI